MRAPALLALALALGLGALLHHADAQGHGSSGPRPRLPPTQTSFPDALPPEDADKLCQDAGIDGRLPIP